VIGSVSTTPGFDATDRRDHPAESYRRLPRASTVAVVAALATATVLAWIVTVHKANSMSAMVMGLGHIGRAMRMGMSAWSFLTMWAVMMVAMMAPTIVPLTLAHRFAAARHKRRVGATAALAVGYFSVWWLLGVPYFVAFLWFHDVSPLAGDSRWLPALAGAILLLAGGYQFTARKAHCLRTCCRPFGVASQHGGGLVDGFRTGWSHGIDCIGCCWAAMLVLLAVGLMNIAWMVGLSILFLAEKHSPRALTLSRLVGGALVILGVAVMIHPTLFHTIAGKSGSLPL